MTNKEAAANYKEMMVDMANMIARINAMKERSEYISEQMHDNSDPACDLSEALEKLGKALASMVTYADEYGKEEEGK